MSPSPLTLAYPLVVSGDKSYALLEFKGPSDATTALAFDGIEMEAHDGMNGTTNGESKGLSIKRPKDYIVPPASTEDAQMSEEGVIQVKCRHSK